MNDDSEDIKILEQEYGQLLEELNSLHIKQREILADYADKLRYLKLQKIRKKL